MREWKGSVAFITGGGQGIGLGIARALGKRGVRLALADIDEAALTRSGNELSRVTAVETFRLDVRDRGAFASAADEVESKLGHVNLLFNNAGIVPHSPVSELRYEQWDLALGVNLTGVVNGLQTLLPRMIERGEGGYVVNTSSGAGLAADPNVLYATAKFAVVGLSESLQLAVSKYGIDVSVLCPGPVDTNIIHNTRSAEEGVSLGGRGGALKDAEAFLKGGASIDSVGEMVIAGMEARSLWIHTDDVMRPYVEKRMAGLLESIPAPAADGAF
ncbi:NAD(P)-dependent dehydrogenase (short-subunit alcohol dehydrogenase family) [Lipingzhangella halophila]|uniref:NAD(P)-dependent dehydrogenase (Short-subunit alcohol dehydrogenase family) n=1 Tax=Lipingzhangella halophila TaxID=1783352 RepID=A0A7W7W2A6_9ACTN|nr:SDR family NAD(P)-dependent oxidoreductase [Lipingzhangella halophila]MBB4930569.1 NAD(P)-dependent dehydrogenase (short-subunit alcohol dehydrogenase family) [Lipingzhangella halophila]